MKNKPRKPHITPEEAELFRRAMSDVARDGFAEHAQTQTGRAKKTLVTPSQKSPAKPLTKPPAKSSQKPLTTPSPKPSAHGVLRDQTAQGDYVEFARGGLQTRVMRKLKRGEFRIADTLDLHGHTTGEAETALEDFLCAAANARMSAVLIIHGKGLRSGGRGGVMKHFVTDWLKRRGEVKAFCSAAARDGGTGAVYVLVKGKIM